MKHGFNDSQEIENFDDIIHSFLYNMIKENFIDWILDK